MKDTLQNVLFLHSKASLVRARVNTLSSSSLRDTSVQAAVAESAAAAQQLGQEGKQDMRPQKAREVLARLQTVVEEEELRAAERRKQEEADDDKGMDADDDLLMAAVGISAGPAGGASSSVARAAAGAGGDGSAAPAEKPSIQGMLQYMWSHPPARGPSPSLSPSWTRTRRSCIRACIN